MTTKTRFKDKWEMEEEDNLRYRKHKEDTFKRRIAKLGAEGFKCTFDGCSEVFELRDDLVRHAENHKQECYKKMICNQPKCGQKVICIIMLLMDYSNSDTV